MAKGRAGRRIEEAGGVMGTPHPDREALPSGARPRAEAMSDGEPVAEGKPDASTPPKRRGRPKGSAEGPKGNVLSIRGSEAWRVWVGRLADHGRLKVADVIDRALIAYARQEGFDEPAPRR